MKNLLSLNMESKEQKTTSIYLILCNNTYNTVEK